MIFRRLSTLFLPAALALSACSGGGELADGRFPTGSQVMATSSDQSALFVANLDQGSVARFELGSKTLRQIELGAQPTRVARAGSRIAVTLRGQRQVAIVEESTGELAGRVDVGAEPFGVVADEAGSRFFVSVSLEDKVVEIDAGSLAIVRTFEAKNQPRWLALHPSGKSLYVASAMGGTLTWIDLEDGRTREIALPRPEGFSRFTGMQFHFTARHTGDGAVSPKGDMAVFPMLFVDNETPVAEKNENDPEGTRPFPGEGGGGGYDNGGETFVPAVALVPVDSDGFPKDEDIELVRVGGFTDQLVAGYMASASFDPSGELVLTTIEGAAGGVAFTVESPNQGGGGTIFDAFAGAARDAAPSLGFGSSFGFRNSIAFKAAAGPRGASFTESNRAYIFSFIDRRVGELDIAPIREFLIGSSDGDDHFRAEIAAPGFSGASFFATRGDVEVVDDVLDSVIARGRRLYFAANDSRMSSDGVGLSCATCHFDGRNDGLTWAFTRGGRQTPSLAGKVSLTAPVRWEGDRETVADDAMSTSSNLMGGSGLSRADAEAIEAFIDTNPEVDVPRKGATDEAAMRGKALFERADVACASCHSGERYTDNQVYSLLGLSRVKTRSLVGVAASAPYFHDGSAATLKEVLLRARDGSMGNTSMLSDAEMNDLVRYLETL